MDPQNNLCICLTFFSNKLRTFLLVYINIFKDKPATLYSQGVQYFLPNSELNNICLYIYLFGYANLEVTF